MILQVNVDAKLLSSIEHPVSSIASPQAMNLYFPQLVGFPVSEQEGEASLICTLQTDRTLQELILFSLLQPVNYLSNILRSIQISH